MSELSSFPQKKLFWRNKSKRNHLISKNKECKKSVRYAKIGKISKIHKGRDKRHRKLTIVDRILSNQLNIH